MRVYANDHMIAFTGCHPVTGWFDSRLKWNYGIVGVRSYLVVLGHYYDRTQVFSSRRVFT